MKKLMMIVVTGWIFSGCYEMPTENINDNYYSTSVTLVMEPGTSGTISYSEYQNIITVKAVSDSVYKIPTGSVVNVRMRRGSIFYKTSFQTSSNDTVVVCKDVKWIPD